jgi:2Fe-2S ferredoxin
MVSVLFRLADGAEQRISPTGGLLMQSAKANDVPGILADCSGAYACATCHVVVGRLVPALEPPATHERDVLELRSTRGDRPALRQIKVDEVARWPRRFSPRRIGARRGSRRIRSRKATAGQLEESGIDGVAELLDERVEWSCRSRRRGACDGRAKHRLKLSFIPKHFSRFRINPHECYECKARGTVILECTSIRIFKSTDAPPYQNLRHAVQFENGLVTRWREFFNPYPVLWSVPSVECARRFAPRLLMQKKPTYYSEGDVIVGDLYWPDGLDSRRHPAILRCQGFGGC